MSDLVLPDPALARDLVAARQALHLAVQVPAAAGATHLPDAVDFQHTNLGWARGARALVGRQVGRAAAALVVPDLAWAVVDDRGRVKARRPAAGRTIDEGLAWLGDALAEAGGPSGALDLGDWPLPGGDEARSVVIPDADPAHLDQLARWFALMDADLQRLRTVFPDAPEPRCWPHHFDLALLVSFDEGDPERARSLGIGLSPGDDAIAEPYVSVSPWPYPEPRTGPDLPLGTWHTEGWFGAVLRGSEAGERPDIRVAAFIAGAIDAGRTMLDV